MVQCHNIKVIIISQRDIDRGFDHYTETHFFFLNSFPCKYIIDWEEKVKHYLKDSLTYLVIC